MSKPNAPKEGSGFHSGRKTPKPEKVRVLSLENDSDEARQASVNAQNTSLTPSGDRIVNVIANNGKSVLTHDAGGE
jgi:hypothetical protein